MSVLGIQQIAQCI